MNLDGIDFGTPGLTVIAGLPACGKTTLAHALAPRLGATVLTKDVVCGGAETAAMRGLGEDPDDRDSEVYRNMVYPLSMRILFTAVEHLVNLRIPLILDSPFLDVAQRAIDHHTSFYEELVEELDATPGLVIWVGGDAEFQEANMRARSEDRDTNKLQDFAAYRRSLGPLAEILPDAGSPGSMTLYNGDLYGRAA